MSLDVNLIVKTPACKCCGREEERSTFFEANITSNLRKMAREAGIHDHLWNPEEIGATVAKDIILPMKNALRDMRDRPDHYKKFDSPNDWGTYDDFVPWIGRYLQACIASPKAVIEAST